MIFKALLLNFIRVLQKNSQAPLTEVLAHLQPKLIRFYRQKKTLKSKPNLSVQRTLRHTASKIEMRDLLSKTRKNGPLFKMENHSIHRQVATHHLKKDPTKKSQN